LSDACHVLKEQTDMMFDATAERPAMDDDGVRDKIRRQKNKI
jgi:hypothetical protein